MITRQPDGTVEFRVFATNAHRVQLLGSFTGWERSPFDLTPEGDGWFVGSLRLEPGDHEFQYLADGTAWMADFGAFGVRFNEYGLWVSQLHIEEPASPRLTVETRRVRPTPTPAPGGRIATPAA
jgi:hypothetical protein